MNHTLLLVQVVKGFGHLRNDMSREIFAKVGESYDLVEQLASWCQLEHDEVVFFGFEKVDETDDVGVLHLTHDLNLFENVGSLQARVSRDSALDSKDKKAAHLDNLGLFLVEVRMQVSITLRNRLASYLNSMGEAGSAQTGAVMLATYLSRVHLEFAHDLDRDLTSIAFAIACFVDIAKSTVAHLGQELVALETFVDG